jgi:hypothetical protein
MPNGAVYKGSFFFCATAISKVDDRVNKIMASVKYFFMFKWCGYSGVTVLKF